MRMKDKIIMLLFSFLGLFTIIGSILIGDNILIVVGVYFILMGFVAPSLLHPSGCPYK